MVRSLLVLPALVLLVGCRPSAPADGFSLEDVSEADALVDIASRTDARAVVVNVWATWCGPCIAEMPFYIRYDDERDGEGVEVRFLSVDDPGIRPRVESFLQERDWDEVAYLALSSRPVQGLARAAQWTWDGSIPFTVVFVDGRARDAWIGTTTYQDLVARVDHALETAGPPDDVASL